MESIENKDFYYEFYKTAKLSEEDLLQFEDFEKTSEDELELISDHLFELAILAEKIITESND